MNESFASVPLSHVDQMSFILRILAFMKVSRLHAFVRTKVWTDTHDMVIIGGMWARKGKTANFYSFIS